MQVADIKERAAPILSRHGASEAYLFGSSARGKAGSKSDIDILVRFKKLIGLFEHVRVKHELEDALGKHVDLVHIEALRPEFKTSVDKDKVRIV